MEQVPLPTIELVVNMEPSHSPTHQARSADELFGLQYGLPPNWWDISISRLNSHRRHLSTEDRVKISKMRRRIRNRWYAKVSRGRKAKSTMAASMLRERPRQEKVDIEGRTVYNPSVKDQIPELFSAKRFMAEPGEAGITTAASPPVHVNTTHLFTLGTSRQPAEPLPVVPQTAAPTSKLAGQRV